MWLPDWKIAKQLEKGDSSIKGLGWIDLAKDKVDITEFEYWSQLCLRKFYPSVPFVRSGFKVLRSTGLSSCPVLVVAGRIGSGKSETAAYLSRELDCPVIKSSVMLMKLAGIPPIVEIGRPEFQSRALSFIGSPGNPERFADFIAASVAELRASRCVVDGIRQLATHEALSQHFGGETGLLFVQTPADVAYEMYRAREVESNLSFSYRDFLSVYDAPVEAEIPSLGRKAHVYIYNSFGLDAFRRILDHVADYLKNGGSVISRGKARARFPGDAA
jgi:hypothetical protein